ncbi:MAG: DsbC family protein [Pseudomonadota bacterium]|nr:DsbC family protein [Pseudomonadota bacterium]
MNRLASVVLLGTLSLSACAQSPSPAVAAKPGAESKAADTAQAPKPAAGTPDARAVEAIRKLNAQVKIDHVGVAPVPGFREVVVAGQTIYISDDGRYLLQGNLFDTTTKTDLSQASLGKVRRELLKTIPASDRIVFAPPNPKYTLSVFTDIECGYCQKLHGDIAEYNRQGIAIEYLAFPRMGLGSPDHKKMIAVWCATDRKKALTDAKAGRNIAMKDCTNPVTMQYDLGQRIGLTGTPMLINSDGKQLPGYMPPAEMRAALDKMATETAAKPATGA